MYNCSAIDIHYDGHIHTRLCNHAIGEMEEYVLAAIHHRLREICFLEHMETGVNYFQKSWLSDQDFDLYFREGKRLQRKYAQDIRIHLGVELGYNRTHLNEILRRVQKYQWDRIGISCHFLAYDDSPIYLNLLSRQEDNIIRAREIGTDRILTDYFTNLTEAVDNLPGSVLCHLDAALRHLPEIELTENHYAQIRTLLATVKRNGMSMEINTSGISLRNKPFPAPEIVAAAIEMEIPLTAGSDAHHPEDVGRHFQTLPDYINLAKQTSPCRVIRH